VLLSEVSAEVDGVKYPITRDGAMKPDPNEPKTWGIQKQPDGTLKKTDMSYEEALAAYEDARASGGAKISNDEVPQPGSYRGRINSEPENNRKTLLDLKNA